MSKLSDTKTVELASFFSQLCQTEMFQSGFLIPLRTKEEAALRALKTSDNQIDVARMQGALKMIDEVLFLLGRHQDKQNTLNKGEFYVRPTRPNGSSTN